MTPPRIAVSWPSGRGIIRRARSIAVGFEAQVQKIDDQATRTNMSDRWKVRKAVLAELEHRMIGQLRRPPFRDVTRPEITAAGLNAIASHPMYARAWRLGWKSMRAGVAGRTSADRLWTSPTWEVYERWCFGPDWPWTSPRSGPDLSWTGVEFGGKGAEARALGRGPDETIEILFQPSFPRADALFDPWLSVNREGPVSGHRHHSSSGGGSTIRGARRKIPGLPT